MVRIPLGDLKPAAARLLLAFLSSNEDDTWNTVMIRSGIHDVRTYILARLSLEQKGFIVTINGREYVTLYTHIEESTPAGVTGVDSQAGEEVVDTGITQPVTIPPFNEAKEEAAEVNAKNELSFKTAWAGVTKAKKFKGGFGL